MVEQLVTVATACDQIDEFCDPSEQEGPLR